MKIVRQHGQWYVVSGRNAGVGRTPLAAWRSYRAMRSARRRMDGLRRFDGFMHR